MGVQEDINELESKLNRLRMLYDQYCTGILKVPPFKLHDEVKRIIKVYSGRQINNTALAFKYRSLAGRYTSLNNLWTRNMRQIDEGTFRRGKKSGIPDKKEEDADAKLTSKAKKLFDAYVRAKVELGQGTDNLKVKEIEDSVKKQVPKLKLKYKCKDVDYKVIVEGEKVKIKVTPVM